MRVESLLWRVQGSGFRVLGVGVASTTEVPKSGSGFRVVGPLSRELNSVSQSRPGSGLGFGHFQLKVILSCSLFARQR